MDSVRAESEEEEATAGEGAREGDPARQPAETNDDAESQMNLPHCETVLSTYW